MIIGVPKEVKNNEYRVGLTPESSMALCKEGYEVLIQSNAGSSIGFSNQDYIDSGAKIIDEAEEVFDKSNLLLKSVVRTGSLDHFNNMDDVIGKIAKVSIRSSQIVRDRHLIKNWTIN